MRKLISFLLLLPLLVPSALAADGTGDLFSLGCTAAVLMERETGTVLYAKDEHRHLSPASVTKVMTLLLVAEAVDSGAVRADDIVTASPRAASMGGSQIWLKEGEQMTVAEMTKCVAVVSANDCAVALAELLCGSEEAFTRRMNERAAQLGMNDTHFTNCTGLFEDPDHYTSAYDVALMSRELLCHDFIRQFTAIWTDAVRDGEFGLTNTNKLVRYYPGCTGLKTGFTTAAMFCLAASASRDGTEYVAVILHDETSQRRFDDARALLDYAFANYALVTPKTELLPAVPVELGTAESVSVVCAESGSVVVEKAVQSALEPVIELSERVSAPVEAGQRLGSLRLMAGEETIAEVPLLAAESVPALTAGQIWLLLVKKLCTL
ncbi:MAG: D-alanyl-D-alanine carboxypeptidase [Oscillospiraceae bacterium]|nr:D-alanyl-D-alanine carboxypeptidase [Oscillospiraceae bacterium]